MAMKHLISPTFVCFPKLNCCSLSQKSIECWNVLTVHVEMFQDINNLSLNKFKTISQ